MKFLLTFFSLCLVINLFAQSNYPLNVEHGQWNFSSQKTHANSCYDCCSDYSLYFAGDTVINSITYQTLLRKGINYFTGRDPQSNIYYDCGDSMINSYQEVAAFIRNDSINKKVFIYDSANQVDTLLYNFDLAVGDTLKDTYIFSASRTNDPFHVVDSIAIQSIAGSNRKVFYTSKTFGLYKSFVIYEGIGFDTLGSLIYYSNTAVEYTSICYSDQNGTLPANVSCNLITSTFNATLSPTELNIYPNPSNGKLFIECKESLNRIEIFNLQGQKIKEVKPTESQFELPEENGLYLLRIEDDEGNIYSQKVIKE